jgi:exopolysaccharide biosynthesis polyprenyl glycosylphosphotransferase
MSVVSLGSTADEEGVGLVAGGQVAAPAGLGVLRLPRLRDGSDGAHWVTGLGALVPGVLIASMAEASTVPLACALLWAALVVARAVFPRPVVGTRDRVWADLRSALGLGGLVALAGVAGLVPLGDTRWSLLTLAAAATSTVALPLVRRRQAQPRRVVLVGGQPEIEAHLAAADDPGVLVAGGYLVDVVSGPTLAPAWDFPVVNTLDGLPDLVAGVGADDVLVLPGGEITSDVVRRVSWELQDTPVALGVACPVSSVSGHRLHTARLGDTLVLGVGGARASRAEQLVKDVIDRVGAAVLLLVLAPLLAVLMAAVRLDSKGPALFVQTRVGRNGELFRMFKLRSMHRDAESILASLAKENEAGDVLFKIRRDPRVTRLGCWLRKASLDELPQLLNVLRGEMSLVGPRPALPSEVATYDEIARRRLAVKPGLTGLWQVSGRSDLPWDESLRLDLYYTDNWTLSGDIAIAARTLGAVTRARGAY